MVTAVAGVGREVRSAKGEVVAYVLPAEELEQIRTELAALREQNATLLRQRDHYASQLEGVLKTYVPVPRTVEEMKATKANSDDLARLIADLESR
jgi:hypothetical protein